MASISNTLSRWHKVAGRIKSRITELQAEIRSATAEQHLDVDSFIIRKERMQANASEAYNVKLPLMLELNAALFEVRKQLAEANVKFGVSAALVEMELARQNQILLQDIHLDSLDSGYVLTTADFEKLVALKKAAPAEQQVNRSSDRAAVSFADTEKNSQIETQIEELGRKVVGLSDKLSDLNATKLSIDLPELVCKELGL